MGGTVQWGSRQPPQLLPHQQPLLTPGLYGGPAGHSTFLPQYVSSPLGSHFYPQQPPWYGIGSFQGQPLVYNRQFNHYPAFHQPTGRQQFFCYPAIYIGTKIGSISIPPVTVADDLALITGDKSDAQVMVRDADNSAGRERYCIHPSKSHTLWYTQRKKKDAELDIFMAGDNVDTPNSTVHIGIVRNTSGKRRH